MWKTESQIAVWESRKFLYRGKCCPKKLDRLWNVLTFSTFQQIEYKMSMETLRQKVLQVSIWDHDVLKENNLLGAVYIRFRDLDLSTTVSQWYKLDKLQITDASTF